MASGVGSARRDALELAGSQGARIMRSVTQSQLDNPTYAKEAGARFESLRCAIRTLRQEIFGFRFDYPLQVVPQAGPRDSLHYYLYSDRLGWKAMRLDSSGIPRAWERTTGAEYWPGYIAWYGLVNLGHYLRHRQREHLDIFLNQIRWLERHAVLRDDGAVVWQMDFDYRVGDTLLKSSLDLCSYSRAGHQRSRSRLAAHAPRLRTRTPY